jgi:predicted TIM-barrel fold metal-dependent hydrolase
VYPDSEPNTLVADLDTTRELVAGHPELLMLGTVCVPEINAAAIEKLSYLAAAGDIIGIKLYPGFELFYPDDERCYAVYEMCIEHNMPVVFHSGETMDEAWREEYNHPRQIAKVAKRFPTLKIVVAHFSQPHLTACRDVVLTYLNVYADISGLAHPDVIERCGREMIAGTLIEVVTQQPEKVLFGTDWPICDVGEHLALVWSLPVSEKTKDLITSRNAEMVFALG